jgi:hypothetical protein
MLEGGEGEAGGGEGTGALCLKTAANPVGLKSARDRNRKIFKTQRTKARSSLFTSTSISNR